MVPEAPAEIKALVVASVQQDNERQVSLTALPQPKKKRELDWEKVAEETDLRKEPASPVSKLDHH